jgi:gamma-glutamyltranspeptidase/glutathione hydrolase
MKSNHQVIQVPLRWQKFLLANCVLLSTLLSGGACSQHAVVDPGPEQSIPKIAVVDSGLKQPIIRYDSIHHPVVGRFGMVVSQNSIATGVGQDILARGGNAVDAAVAVSFALAVTLPRAGNLGGSGFMLTHLAAEQKTIALDYRSVAPMKASVETFRKPDGEMDMDKLTFGPMAAGVPGTVAAMHQAWLRFGSMPWKQVLQPAYQLASEGFMVGHDLAYVLNLASTVLKYYSGDSAYIRKDGQAWVAGDMLIQSDLAWSIEQIMEHGAAAFYEGELATRITKAFEKAGGILTQEDLSGYEVKERTPVSSTYRGKQVIAAPLVSGGGVTLLQMLNMLENFPLADFQPGSAQNLHLLAEVMKRAAANRRSLLGDPDFVKVHVDGYISKELAGIMAEKIDIDRAADVKNISAEPVDRYESRNTTHFSVMDMDGNAVSNTYTLGYSFGSGFVAEGTGILFDNQMRNFSYQSDQNHLNALEPGKRMLSTMTPTIVLDEHGKVLLVTGTPGGSRIINVILQVLVNVIDHGMNVAEATHQPRIHQGWQQQTLGIETGMNPETVKLLKAMGHEIEMQKTMGSTQSIMWRQGTFYGAADPRRPNALALGLNIPLRDRNHQDQAKIK